MRENPDGFPSSPGAPRAAAPIPVYRWDFLKGLAHMQVSGGEAWVTAGINPAFSTTRGKYDP
jgi:hypothetical protein